MSFTDVEDGGVMQDNFAERLFVSSRASSIDENIWSGVRIKFVSTYDRYISGQNYVHPIGEYFTCYNTGGGTTPSYVWVQTTLGGDLYSKSGSTYSFIQGEYTYQNPYRVNSPAFSTVYSKNNTMASNRCVVPVNAYKGLVLDTEAVINGTTYWWAVRASDGW